MPIHDKESGRDVVQGGARCHVGPVLTGIGIADTANALACPKFGNDDDAVDGLAIEISDFYHREIQRYRDIYGRPFNSAFMGISNNS